MAFPTPTLFADNYSIPNPTAPTSGGLARKDFIYTITRALVLNDIIALCQVGGQGAASGAAELPAPGFQLVQVMIDIPQLDTGSTIRIQVGDTTTVDRFVPAMSPAAVNLRVASAASATTATGIIGFKMFTLPLSYTTPQNLLVTVSTGPGTGTTTGVIQGYMLFTQAGYNAV